MSSDSVGGRGPLRTSFLAIPEDHPFPLQNLPYCVFQRGHEPPRCGVGIGDWILDLAVLEATGWLPPSGGSPVFARRSLNAFASLRGDFQRRMRAAISRLLDAAEPRLRDAPVLRDRALVPQSSVQLLLPFDIGDYTDFYSSQEHATNVGIMLRGKDQALQPNWKHLPVAYHGRASSVVVSGTPIRRPCGQRLPDGATTPVFGPTRALDFELEMGLFVGAPNALGEPIPIAQAESHIFGLSLVNDWSARDIQRWEYVPLGPFLAKNFATSVAPWVVPLAALEPVRCAGPQQDPPPLPYLAAPGPSAFDIQLEVRLQPRASSAATVISRSNVRYLYWSMAQQIAHHTITGCNLRTGDLLASGTISGPTADSGGSLLELAWRGERPLELPDGERRSVLLDGDTLILSAWAQGPGYRIGFGEVTGRVLPALQ